MPRVTLDPVPRPLDHLLLQGAGEALVVGADRLNYAEAEAAVGALAGALLRRGLPKGARVATWLPKTVDACLMPLAAARAGLVHVPINPVLKRLQVAHILADADATLLLTGEGRAASLEPGDLPAYCEIWPAEEARSVLHSADVMPPSEANPEDLVALLYTSGSTGRPKGVMLSHANLWLGAVSVAHYLGLAPDDRTLALLPLGFDYGQNQLFSTWMSGGCAHPLDFLTPRDVVRAVERAEITTLAGVPPLWTQLVAQEWGRAGATVRRVTNSGGALTPRLIAELQRCFPAADIVPMYGLTEAFRSTWLPPELVAEHPTSIGRAIPFAEVMVVDAEGRDGDRGELVHAGPLVAQGYWRDPERTAARFRPAPAWSHYGGTAVWSGDTVTRDGEGLLTFAGRDDELIKSFGHRISPQEIEEAALASGEASEAVAHGVADPELGQAIRLVVAGSGDDKALRLWLKRDLPSHMQPRELVRHAALPRNANGKLDRAAIRAEVA